MVLEYLVEGPGPDPKEYECPETSPKPFEEWSFNSDDDRFCRSEANELLRIVQEQYPRNIEDEQEFCDLYSEILENLDFSGESITDNEEFL